jgi:hypothetical protein
MQGSIGQSAFGKVENNQIKKDHEKSNGAIRLPKSG